jgi:transposase-like protein
MLLEGASVRSTERLTGLHRDTILRLLVAAGEKCEKLMGRCWLISRFRMFNR